MAKSTERRPIVGALKFGIAPMIDDDTTEITHGNVTVLEKALVSVGYTESATLNWTGLRFL